MRTARLIAAGAGVLLVASSANAALLAQYLFNEGSGTTTANLGTAGSAGDLTFGGSPAPTFSAPGFTPLGSGFSMDNTASPAGLTGGYAQTAAAATFLNDLSQATITGWFNTESSGSLARLVDRADASVGVDQWSLYFDGDTSKLQLNLSGTQYISNSNFGGTGSWIFFAAVINEFDGVDNRIRFYAGDITNASSLAGNLVSSSAGLGANTKKLTVGNRENAGRAFDGWLWDIRIYDQALTAAEVEDLRVSSIPEPVSMGLLIPLSGLLLRRRNR